MPQVGLDTYSLKGPSGREIGEPDVFSMLRNVKELGGDGLQASVPDDPAQIREAFDLAESLGLYLEPFAQLPIHWKGDAELIVRSLRELAPMLREHHVSIGIENHWDYTTYELVEIAERAGPDVAGIGLDTGNLLILGEAPDRAIERAAPYTVTTHLKDVYLISTPRGAARPIVPLGEGQVDIAAVVRRLRALRPDLCFTIEDHPVIYDLDYFESSWLQAVPELTTYDVASMARLAREGDRWVAEHRVPELRLAELVPWSICGPSRLRADIARVRKMLAAEVRR